ncbi:pyrophosphate-dependent phosphofructokinase [Tribonema minus]|uniref:Pyrophosphate-dependent phosphofructokinase n=1 Tax=Tribonema minus TaxID=303371 RepID=A0A835ZA90_9STRA|nr:pyrophosphate-dependent phosphofructokinase [Tribonema minus]
MVTALPLAVLLAVPHLGRAFLASSGRQSSFSPGVTAAVGRQQSSRDAVSVQGDVDESFGEEGVPEGWVLPKVPSGQIYLAEVPCLSDYFPSMNIRNDMMVQALSGGSPAFWNRLLGPDDCVIIDPICGPDRPGHKKALLRAGPRPLLHFDPQKTVAAIVTCGGLCPGLNSVIHHLTETLVKNYSAQRVIGVRGGFAGFYNRQLTPLDLTVSRVDRLQHQGGTLLGTSRGGFELDNIIAFLRAYQVTQLYVIGGDGTHRAAQKIAMECKAQQLNIAVAGVPKTIDNDVDMLDRSFGFETSVETAQAAITSAVTEASCNLPNGIGIVKLMGRSSGFIAAHATLASGDVDLCLVPEMPLVLEGPKGCLPHLMQRVHDKGYAVVVVAEGAGENVLGSSAEVDLSGNKKLPKVAEFMQHSIEDFFHRHNLPVTCKSIDPSYTIRSVPANASDQILCMQLAQNAVHAAMAGYTAFTVGLVNNKAVLIPMSLVTATSPRCLDPYGRVLERVLSTTLQPSTLPYRPPKGGLDSATQP